jgi:hypothetical protein
LLQVTFKLLAFICSSVYDNQKGRSENIGQKTASAQIGHDECLALLRAWEVVFGEDPVAEADDMADVVWEVTWYTHRAIPPDDALVIATVGPVVHDSEIAPTM